MLNTRKSPLPNKEKYRYLLAFGSNIGNLELNCQRGLSLLAKRVRITQRTKSILTKPLSSSKYSTKNHGNYLNFLTEVITHMTPKDLYQTIVFIEDTIGHSRERKWLPRKIDIDILLWCHNKNHSISKCPSLDYQGNTLVIPHKDLENRSFWVESAKEIPLDLHNFSSQLFTPQ